MTHGGFNRIDQRRHNRFRIEGIHGSILNSNDLEVMDISVGGAAIETARRLELNREYTIRIHCRGSSFQVRVMIVWAMLISKERHDGAIMPFYRAGINFLHMSAEKADLIRNCMAHHMEMKTRGSGQSRITYCF